MLELKYIALNDLLEMQAPENAKEHDIALLIKSIEKFGFIEPVCIDIEKNTIYSGHGRCLALQQIQNDELTPPKNLKISDSGDWLIPAVTGQNFENRKTLQAALLILNKSVELGGWNEDTLIEQLNSLLDEDLLDFTGFSMNDINTIEWKNQDINLESFFEEKEESDL